MKKGRITAFLLAGIMILPGCTSGSQNAANAQDVNGNSEFHISDITPADDYFGYINAETLMNTELEPGKRYAGVSANMSKNTSEQIDGLIDEIVLKEEEYPQGSNEQIIRDAYNLITAFCEGDEQKDQYDEALITGLIEHVNQIEDMDELVDYWCVLSSDYNVEVPFKAGVTSDIYDTTRNILMVDPSLPVSLDIISDDIKAGLQRDSLKAVLCMTGLDEATARDRATDMIYMFSSIAGKCEFEDEDEKDKYSTEGYVYYSKDDVSKRLDNLSYESLCGLLGYKDRLPDELCIPYMDQFESIEATLSSEYLEEWKSSTTVMILSDTSGLFPRKYNQADINPDKADETAKAMVKKLLETPVSEVYAERYEIPAKVEMATEICNDLKDEYYNLIDEADWMSEEGKAYCRDKLDNMLFFIGSGEPHELDTEDGDLIGETAYQTYLNFMKYAREEHKKSLFEPTERNGYTAMSAITINACYVPTENLIVIPTAYMADEKLDLSKPYEWNLGNLGSTIGHEISHAFDSNGIQYDGRGNYVPEKMPREDRDAFKAMQDKAIEYYSTFTFLGTHINGRNTITENFADISGLQACLEIAGTSDKQKIVLEAYTQKYCNLYTDEALKSQIATDEHAPDNIRVNAVVSLFDCFYEIYGVKEGDPMYVAPENRIRRW